MKKQTSRVVVDLDKLSDVLKAFCTVSHLRITFYDTDFNEVLVYPEEQCEFCRFECGMHSNCRRYCDQMALMRCFAQKSTVGYTCHMGLYKAVTPLCIDDEIVGYIAFDQLIRKKYRKEITDNILAQYQDSEMFHVVACALDDIRTMSDAEIEASMLLVRTCISFIFSMDIVSIERSDFLEELNTYIENHISEDITVDDLCRYFGMSRSSFYEMSDQCIPGG